MPAIAAPKLKVSVADSYEWLYLSKDVGFSCSLRCWRDVHSLKWKALIFEKLKMNSNSYRYTLILTTSSRRDLS